MSRSLRQDRPSSRPPARGQDVPPHLVALRGRIPERELRAPSVAPGRSVSLQTKLLISYVILGAFLLVAVPVVRGRLLPDQPLTADAVLLALTLVVGILVDDAIVEIENIMRHLRMGKTPYQAAMEAADEIGLAVIATTFTLIAVFLPTAFMSGVPGKFFVQFGWTAAIAVWFSLVVARMLTPMMAAYLLKPHTQPGTDPTHYRVNFTQFLTRA